MCVSVCVYVYIYIYNKEYNCQLKNKIKIKIYYRKQLKRITIFRHPYKNTLMVKPSQISTTNQQTPNNTSTSKATHPKKLYKIHPLHSST